MSNSAFELSYLLGLLSHQLLDTAQVLKEMVLLLLKSQNLVHELQVALLLRGEFFDRLSQQTGQAFKTRDFGGGNVKRLEVPHVFKHLVEAFHIQLRNVKAARVYHVALDQGVDVKEHRGHVEASPVLEQLLEASSDGQLLDLSLFTFFDRQFSNGSVPFLSQKLDLSSLQLVLLLEIFDALAQVLSLVIQRLVSFLSLLHDFGGILISPILHSLN